MQQQVVDQRRFWGYWLVANAVGFFVGSFLGATDGGVVSQLLTRSTVVDVLGDLVFGFCFGTAQWLVLRHFYPESRATLWWWIPAAMIGFSIGARLGGRIAPMVGENQTLVGFVFGIVMGGSLGLVQWGAIQFLGALKTTRPLIWIPTSIVAWVIGESIAFYFHFSQTTVPLVGLAIAIVSGIALLWWIRPR